MRRFLRKSGALHKSDTAREDKDDSDADEVSYCCD